MHTTTKHASVELLDNGQFIVTRKDEQKIKGRFSMVAFDRFCDLKKTENYFVLLQKITIGMSIGDYADLLLCAFQDYYRTNPEQCPVKRVDVLDMIDELGGLGETFLSIIFHAIGRVTGGIDESKIEDAKKKLSQMMAPQAPKPGRKKR